MVLGQHRSAGAVGRGTPVQRHLSIPRRGSEGGRGLQRPGVVGADAESRVAVAGRITGRIRRNLQRYRCAVVGRRPDFHGPAFPGWGSSSKAACRGAGDSHVSGGKTGHHLGKGDRDRPSGVTPVGREVGGYYRRGVVHLVGVVRPVRQRGCQRIAGRVLNVLSRVKTQRHRVIEISQVTTAGGHVIGGSRAAHRCHGYVRAADARTRDGEVRVVHVHHRLAEGYPPHQTVGIGLPTAMGALTGDGRYRRRYGVGGAGDGAKDCSGKAVPGAAHRPHLEIINCPVGQTGDRKAGLVVEGLVTVAVGHVSPPDPR